jgi:hypothetical protein
VRLLILAIANVWSGWLAVRVIERHAMTWSARIGACFCFIAALAVVDSAWWLMFWHW